MKLFYSPGACSLAAHIALEEAGVAFEPVRTALVDGDQRAPAFLARNPQGRVPVLEFDGQILTELMAILLYVDDRFGRGQLMPKDPWRRAQAASLMAFLANNVHIDFAGIWRAERFSDDAAAHPGLERQGRQNLLEHLGLIEAKLPTKGWVGGECFSLADMNLLPFYRFGWRVGLDMHGYPRYTGLVAAACQRPAVQRVLQREGVASLLMPEAAHA
jgi:glutathione S-transferase